MIIDHVQPNPVEACRLASVSKSFYAVFTSDNVWRRFDPYGVKTGIYHKFLESSDRDLGLIRAVWDPESAYEIICRNWNKSWTTADTKSLVESTDNRYVHAGVFSNLDLDRKSSLHLCNDFHTAISCAHFDRGAFWRFNVKYRTKREFYVACFQAIDERTPFTFYKCPKKLLNDKQFIFDAFSNLKDPWLVRSLFRSLDRDLRNKPEIVTASAKFHPVLYSGFNNAVREQIGSIDLAKRALRVDGLNFALWHPEYAEEPELEEIIFTENLRICPCVCFPNRLNSHTTSNSRRLLIRALELEPRYQNKISEEDQKDIKLLDEASPGMGDKFQSSVLDTYRFRSSDFGRCHLLMTREDFASAQKRTGSALKNFASLYNYAYLDYNSGSNWLSPDLSPHHDKMLFYYSVHEAIEAGCAMGLTYHGPIDQSIIDNKDLLKRLIEGNYSYYFVYREKSNDAFDGDLFKAFCKNPKGRRYTVKDRFEFASQFDDDEETVSAAVRNHLMLFPRLVHLPVVDPELLKQTITRLANQDPKQSFVNSYHYIAKASLYETEEQCAKMFKLYYKWLTRVDDKRTMWKHAKAKHPESLGLLGSLVAEYGLPLGKGSNVVVTILSLKASPHSIKLLPDDLRKDKKFMSWMVGLNHNCLMYLDKEWRLDAEMQEAVWKLKSSKLIEQIRKFLDNEWKVDLSDKEFNFPTSELMRLDGKCPVYPENTSKTSQRAAKRRRVKQ